MDDCLASTRRGGRIVVAGAFEQPYSVNLLNLLLQEHSITGTFGYADEFEEARDLIVGGKIDVSPLISRIVSLEELPSVFEQLTSTATATRRCWSGPTANGAARRRRSPAMSAGTSAGASPTRSETQRPQSRPGPAVAVAASAKTALPDRVHEVLEGAPKRLLSLRTCSMKRKDPSGFSSRLISASATGASSPTWQNTRQLTTVSNDASSSGIS